MEQRHFEYFCQTQSKLHGICVRIYEDGGLRRMSHFYSSGVRTIEADIPLNLTVNASKMTKQISLLEEGAFILGCIRFADSGRVLLLGPARFGEITKSDIASVIRKYGLPKIMEEKVALFLHSTPVMLLENFLMLLSVFNLVMNGEVTYIQEIAQGSNDILAMAEEKNNFIEIADVERSKIIYTNYDEALSYHIKNGDVEAVRQLNYEDFSRNVGSFGPTQMRSLKNMLIVLNSICLRAAIQGGLDAETAYTLGERYTTQIEDAASLARLQVLSSTIRLDYCTRVKNLHIPQTNNVYIAKAEDYIRENIYTKLTIAQLAEHLGIQPEYLAALASQNLGCTMSQYIMGHKIAEAKKLLRFTDKSLAEIAYLLCFSSQSHFQRQFKKIRGMTPTEYRKKYRLESKSPRGCDQYSQRS